MPVNSERDTGRAICPTGDETRSRKSTGDHVGPAERLEGRFGRDRNILEIGEPAYVARLDAGVIEQTMIVRDVVVRVRHKLTETLLLKGDDLFPGCARVAQEPRNVCEDADR